MTGFIHQNVQNFLTIDADLVKLWYRLGQPCAPQLIQMGCQHSEIDGANHSNCAASRKLFIMNQSSNSELHFSAALP